MFNLDDVVKEEIAAENERRLTNLKSKVRQTVHNIAANQAKIAALLAETEELKKSLKELKLDEFQVSL